MAHKYDEMYHLEKSIPDYWALKKLKDLAFLVTDRIDVSKVSLENYVSTENMLPNKSGIEKAIKMPRYGSVTRFESRDILLSNIRPYFKKIWLAKFNGGCSNDVLVIKAKNDVSHSFLYYCLQQDPFFNYVTSSSKGTKMPRGDKVAIFSFEFPVPPLDEQKAIAKILSDLDSKIELNEKMNKTLETIAQAIFKHWFIDFEFPNEEGKPYKSSGGEMVDSELGMIPSNWTIKKLDDIANFLNGLPLQKYPAISGERYFPVIKIKEMNSGISTSSDKASCDIPPEYIVANGDILFAWSGSLGVTIWCNGMGALNQHLFKVSSTEYPKWFYYQWLLHYLPDFIEIAKYKATTMGHIQRQHLSKSLVAVPDSNTFKMMNTIFNPIINRIINLRVEKDVLAKTRDIILPKLMTGKIRVSLEDKNDKQNE